MNPGPGCAIGLGATTPPTVNAVSITGVSLGVTNAYFGEDGSESYANDTHTLTVAGFIEKSALPAQGRKPDRDRSRHQPTHPELTFARRSNVYWTTSRCDIMKLADDQQ